MVIHVSCYDAGFTHVKVITILYDFKHKELVFVVRRCLGHNTLILR